MKEESSGPVNGGGRIVGTEIAHVEENVDSSWGSWGITTLPSENRAIISALWQLHLQRRLYERDR